MNNTTMPFDKLHLASEKFTNPRKSTGLSEESIRELAINIGLHGILNPPIVTIDGLVIAGQRRYRAIEFLMAWFAVRPAALTAQRPGALDGTRFDELFGDLTHEDLSQIERRVREFEERGVPVRVIEGAGLEGVALADNVQREDLSSYEIAEHLAHLNGAGATQADLVRLIGKSKTYVSRKLSTYRGACAELRAAWAAGELAEDHVQDLAKLPHEQQRRALGQPIPRGRRGPTNRPGIDTIKETLTGLAARVDDVSTTSQQYARGVLDALRWVNGDQTSAQFASVMEVADAGASA